MIMNFIKIVEDKTLTCAPMSHNALQSMLLTLQSIHGDVFSYSSDLVA
jgi:hypothetical protein